MSRTVIETGDGLEIRNTEGNQTTWLFGSQGDLYISNPGRKTDGRVIVENQERLYINYDFDFENGVVINDLRIEHLNNLPTAPEGLSTFNVVV